MFNIPELYTINREMSKCLSGVETMEPGGESDEVKVYSGGGSKSAPPLGCLIDYLCSVH